MYEVIANPEDYKIDDLIIGTGNSKIEFSEEERQKWVHEIDSFNTKIFDFFEKSKALSKVLSGSETIKATPAALKTLKIQLFTINDAFDNVLAIAKEIESEIIPK